MRGKEERVLGLGEALGGAFLQAQVLQLGTVPQAGRDQVGDPVGHGGAGSGSSSSVKPVSFGMPMAAARSACAALSSLCRLHEQQLRVGQIDVGEAHVEGRFQFALGERGDLVDHELARSDGLVGHLQDGLRAEHGEIGAADVEEDLRAGGVGDLVLRRGLELRHLDQVAGAAEVGDHLADRQTRAEAVVDHRDC